MTLRPRRLKNGCKCASVPCLCQSFSLTKKLFKKKSPPKKRNLEPLSASDSDETYKPSITVEKTTGMSINLQQNIVKCHGLFFF